MKTDLDTLATALHARIDDELKASPWLAPWRPVGGIASTLSDAELVTPAVMSALLGHTSERRRLRRAEALAVSEGTVSKHSGSVLTELDLPLPDSTSRRVLSVPAHLRGSGTRQGRRAARRARSPSDEPPAPGGRRPQPESTVRPEPVHQLSGDPPASASGDEGDTTAFLQQAHELGMRAFGFDAAQPRDMVAPNDAVHGPAEASDGPRHGARERLAGHVPLGDQVIFRHVRRPGPGDRVRSESH